MPETDIICSKKELQILDFDSFIIWSNFRFLGDCFRAFELNFYSATPNHKKASYNPETEIKQKVF